MSDVVLLIDDDPAVRTVLGALLRQAGHEVVEAEDGGAGIAMARSRRVDVVVCDVRMPGVDGMAVLGALRDLDVSLPVLMLTAHGTVPLAVEAMRRGATDFLQKPFEREEVLFAIDKALCASRAASGRAPARADLDHRLIGESAPMQRLQEQLDRVAPTRASVLLQGATGTGKELAARILHARSGRRGAFVAINCAALPANLLESELFGHVAGAFTGAVRDKPGRVALADGGTLFLDEIGDMPLSLQPKLLRALEERAVRPLGAAETRPVDVRVLSATHRDLPREVGAGAFRQDLYYRLAAVTLQLPSLAERREDVPRLARAFFAELVREHGRALRLGDDAVARLAARDWPGNVRELRNVIERLVILSEGDVADLGVLAGPDPAPDATLRDQVTRAERDALLAALESARGNRTLAARLLGISRRTLYDKLSAHELG